MFKFLDYLSFKKIAGIGFILSSLIAIPVLAWYSQRVTYQKSQAATEAPMASQNPVSKPQLYGVKPFWGKPGDEVVLWGEDMGVYPKETLITMGGTAVENIRKWEKNQIIFIIPEGAVSGEIRVSYPRWILLWDKPFSVFRDRLDTQVQYFNNTLFIRDYPENISKISVWKTLNDKPSIIDASALSLNGTDININFDSVEWLSIIDIQGKFIPFWVDPLSFGK